MRNLRWMFGASLALFTTTTLEAMAQAPPQAQDRLRTRDPATHDGAEPDQDRVRLRDQLRTELKLTDEEVANLDQEFGPYFKGGGAVDPLRQALRTNAGAGCRGTCLGATVRAMNRAMEAGTSGPEAGQMCQAAFQEQLQLKKGQSTDELGKGLEQRVQARAKEAAGQRDRSRDRLNKPDKAGKGGRGGGGDGSRRGGGNP